MIKRLDAEVQALIAEHGLRNALLTSIAPTGTISLYAGNVSSGIEPVFANAYTRKVLQPDGTRTEEEVVDYAVQMWRDLHGDADLPDHFVTAQDLAPLDHVRMQAAAQPMGGQFDLQDDQRARRYRVRGVQGCLSRSLRDRLQGLHHLPAQRCDGAVS
jgi:hypothetical protein